MCGIFAIIRGNETHIRKYIDNALINLQYRGYDSWGYKTHNGGRVVSIEKYKAGKVSNEKDFNDSSTAIVHTRWATNGGASTKNAHPIVRGGNAIVHNGIVSNADYISNKYHFTKRTDTDTEVILQLWNKNVALIPELEGSFAFVILDLDGNVWAYRQGDTPLYLATDETGSKYFTSELRACYGNNVEYALLPSNQMWLLNADFFVKTKKFDNSEKYNNNEHITLKEFDEVPKLLMTQHLDGVVFLMKKFEGAAFIGSGSSYNAALFGANYYGGRAFFPTVYCLDKVGDKAVLLSQSGESHDILQVANLLKELNPERKLYCITNNPHSTLARLCNEVFDTKCGIERAVASTKSLFGQIKALLHYGTWRLSEKALNRNFKEEARELSKVNSLFILGEGMNYVAAREGALKFKELALIHAEAMETAEFKHGPIALIEPGSVVILIGEDHPVSSQIEARGGKVLRLNHPTYQTIDALYAVQKLAIETAYAKGINPDFPRNLAKAITVA